MALGGKRFRAVGIAATAEIFAVNRIRDLIEGQDTAELTVRISGPGLDTFDADCEAPKSNVPPQVGDRRTVMVNPSDLTFAIVYDHLSNRTSTNRPCSMIRGAPLSPPPRTRSPTSLQAGHLKLETLCNETSLKCSSYTGSELARLSALLVIYRYLGGSERRTVRHSRARRQSHRDSGMAVAQLYSQPNVTAIDKTFSSRLFRLFQRERRGS